LFCFFYAASLSELAVVRKKTNEFLNIKTGQSFFLEKAGLFDFLPQIKGLKMILPDETIQRISS